MKVVITCGPAIAPIDEVRRITNFSTGELGILLANALVTAGHEVVCFKGEAATSTLAFAPGIEVRSFSTNADLAGQLEVQDDVQMIFHAAALCDYEVESVRDEMGAVQSAAKIPSRAGELHLTLRPARKLLPAFRELFPFATIVGWKYELNGVLENALHASARQLDDCGTDFCVVNGAAYGDGFGLLDREGRVRHFADKADLCAGLVALSEKLGA